MAFDSTYKELKRCKYLAPKSYKLTFDSTYKELKPTRYNDFYFIAIPFDSTYKELKLNNHPPQPLRVGSFWLYL